MKILVINAGSSSIKYQLIDMPEGHLLAKGMCDRIGIEGGNFKIKSEGKEQLKMDVQMKDHAEAMSLVTKQFTENNVLIAGNPAKVIGKVEDYIHKYKNYAINWGCVINKEDYFKDNSADVAVVVEFVTTYMLKDEISTSDHSVTEDCAEHYANAKEAFNDLTDEQKDIFNTDSQFSDMKARMVAWALANGEVFTGTGYTSASNVYRFVRNTSDNSIYLVVISISFASIALLAFLLRRKKAI